MNARKLITATAFELFLDKGYRNTSMADLVKATNLSKGAFYHHFTNKEQLYQTVIDTYFLVYYDQIDWEVSKEASVEEIELTIKEFYRAFVPEIMSITKKGMSRYFIMFFEAYETYPKFRSTVRSIYKEMKGIFTEKYTQEGAANPEMDAIRLVAKYEGLLFWLSIYPEEEIEQLIREI